MICRHCNLAGEDHDSGLCDSCETQDRYDRDAELDALALTVRLDPPTLGMAGYGVPDPRDPDGDWLSDGYDHPRAATSAALAEYLRRYSRTVIA